MRQAGWSPFLARRALPAALCPFLPERRSLTRALQRACQTFAVRRLWQGKASVFPDEAAALRLRPGRRAWVREVLLVMDGVPAVFARSVMPIAPRHRFDIAFHALGESALGSLLFANPRIKRSPLEFRRLNTRYPLHRRAARQTRPAPRFWARRSRFNQAAKGILVTEVFCCFQAAPKRPEKTI
ncbi:MAG: chorismate lyase [Zoogloeaceae bacterium]|jgi:chorismate--pyruvate lyase|nr:chorismate lyase [Zoogloeaceae bacterium]